MVLPDREFGEKLAKPFLTFLQKMVLSHKKGVSNGFFKKPYLIFRNRFCI
jgi:hypothetical protein